MLYRAGVMAAAAGDAAAAARHFQASLEANPRSEVAAEARRALQPES
jgi:predicted TPR repeat methyltransferase